MPKSTSKTSDPEGEASNARSVLDFLYHDSRRIASFLAQFEGDGHLQSLTRTKDGSRGKTRASETGVKGTIGIAAGDHKGSTETSVELAEGYARVFDPYWANARAFLDFLSEHGMIEPDITTARMGQFVLVKGSLIVSDLESFREVWKSDIVRRFVIASAQENEGEATEGNRQQRLGNKAKTRHMPKKVSEADLVMELLPHLPHSSQIHIVTDDYAAWGTASAENLTGSFADLALKHGAKIAGEWSAIGILDGMPFEEGELMSPLEQMRVGLTVESVSRVPLLLAPHVRQTLGRPLLSYGITPLLIFREVA